MAVTRRIDITDWVNSGINVITAVTTAPVQTGNTKTADALWWRRVGGSMELRLEFRQTAAGTNTGGSGDYLFRIPSGFTIDTTKVTAFGGVSIGNTASVVANSVGSWSGSSAAGTPTQDAGVVSVYDTTRVRLVGLFSATSGTNSPATIGSGHQPLTIGNPFNYVATFTVPIVGWDVST